jgi:pepF/M3 family oligoendopeptidase
MPRWDLTPFFPALDSPEYDAAIAEVRDGIARLEASLSVAETGAQDPIQTFEQLAAQVNALREKTRVIQAYLGALVTTDSFDDFAQAKDSEFDKLATDLSKLAVRFTAWLGKQDVEALITKSKLAADHPFYLRRSKIVADHLMSPGEEALAADLNPSAGLAWGKLHGNIGSQLMVTVPLPDGEKSMPMSAVRNLAYDPDREVRRAAYQAELAAWKAVDVPLAAAMNGIKGQFGVLAKRRKWESPLDNALFFANIDRAALDAMMTAARESFPDFRRYLKAKAHALGTEHLAWFDLFAPLGSEGGSWPYDKAEVFVEEQFRAFSDKMGDFAARAFRERWIDAEPRHGKRDGAYCSGFRKDESRILMNYKPSFGSVMTLAHELGHGYHNLCLAQRTPMQKETPMTLAETASIFCEAIIKRVYLDQAPAEEQLGILEGMLQGYCQVVVDITSRFLFEQAVFEKRTERDLSAGELSQLMLDSQRQTYGEGLDPELLHPYMWAAKPHYYSSGRSFYNFPYMFGLLFGLGLYSRYEQDPEAFKANYDDLLSSTGMDDAAGLASRFGFDIRTPDFWRGSLNVIRKDIDRFEQLVRNS